MTICVGILPVKKLRYNYLLITWATISVAHVLCFIRPIYAHRTFMFSTSNKVFIHNYFAQYTLTPRPSVPPMDETAVE
jgi:hypothetical protein